jgi:site-specific DNA-methyltransferase (adenine-specific)
MTKQTYKLINGDCIAEMKKMDANSIDSIVTDPPYEIGFMNKGWDNTGIAYNKKMWAEALRVLKPGGHMLAFSSTRTYHRMVCAIEDSGFEIRDQLAWIYGSGFPKSQNVGKKVKEYDGWGTALKPAQEPIVLARKPLSEKTVAANVTKYGTGAIDIDASRVATGTDGKGRWPANIIHDGSEEVLELFPEAGNGWKKNYGEKDYKGKQYKGGTFGGGGYLGGSTYNDTGSAARFFYCAKANKQDRDSGCEKLDAKSITNSKGNGLGRVCNICSASILKPCDCENNSWILPATNKNNHPTVKPTALMQYLVRMITPVDGTVLDPFNGSGSTGKAAMLLKKYNYIGIDLSADYISISKARIENALNTTGKIIEDTAIDTEEEETNFFIEQ